MNRSVVSRFVLVGLLATAGAASVGRFASEARAANAPARNAVLMEDALDAFFFELDRKSTSLYAKGDEPPLEVPSFQGRAELLARFAARQPRVDVLRSKALAGETNRGFLEPRGAPSNLDQSTISEENTDRLALYEAIATQAKAKIDAVGRVRAERIAPMARRGVWVQDTAGDWAQKK